MIEPKKLFKVHVEDIKQSPMLGALEYICKLNGLEFEEICSDESKVLHIPYDQCEYIGMFI